MFIHSRSVTGNDKLKIINQKYGSTSSSACRTEKLQRLSAIHQVHKLNLLKHANQNENYC